MQDSQADFMVWFLSNFWTLIVFCAACHLVALKVGLHAESRRVYLHRNLRPSDKTLQSFWVFSILFYPAVAVLSLTGYRLYLIGRPHWGFLVVMAIVSLFSGSAVGRRLVAYL